LAECDVLIVGAGPAGAIAGIVAARAGARVRLIDRATFPRDKLCGDTLNPGTLSVLRRLGISAAIERVGLRIDGMVLTGERGVAVEGRYPSGVSGCAIVRRDLDWLLVQQAIAAGCQLDTGVAAQRVRVDERGTRREVSGVEVVAGGGTRTIAARVVIAADGRRSAIAFGLGAARHPVRPRRWAIGAYFENFVPIGVRPPAFASSSEPREGGVRPQAFAPSSEPRDGGVRP
jgi:flavin-dependent dehydrogenase